MGLRLNPSPPIDRRFQGVPEIAADFGVIVRRFGFLGNPGQWPQVMDHCPISA
jgi:hypothetical protein